MKEKLQKRYPEIGFFLSFFPFEKVSLLSKSEVFKAFKKWREGQTIEEVEVLYIVGLAGTQIISELLDWLSEKKERSLVFIEDQLGAFESFLRLSIAEDILEHPQIHLWYASQDPIEELAQAFPTDHLAVFALPKKNFNALLLMRKSAALSALYSDVLYSHLIFENLLPNFFRLNSSFNVNAWEGEFEGIPAIICGAGPSLQKSFPMLKKAGDRALIFAGGSAITILSQNGIRPHFAMALDPNHEEYERLKQSLFFAGPFLFAPRLHRDIFATCSGPFGYLKSDTGGLAERWLEEKLGMDKKSIGPDLGPEAFSVTSLAISYAYAMGCHPIILTGVDLAYTDGLHYAPGVEITPLQNEDPRALERRLVRTDIHAKKVETLLKWVMEADAIATFAKSHPKRLFLNATDGGIGFEQIENISLETAIDKYCKKSRDFEGRIHQLIQITSFKIDTEKLQELCALLEASLQRSETICDQMLLELEKSDGKYCENGKMVLLKYNFEEESAYPCFLECIEAALKKLLVRYYPHLDPEEAKLLREIAKFKELRLQIENFRKILHKQLVYCEVSGC